MATQVGAARKPAQAGEIVAIRDATTPIPDRCLRPDVIMTVKGQQSELLRLKSVTGDGAGRVYTFANLIRRQSKSFTHAELEVMRPLAFVIPDRSWRRLRSFVDGAIYQVWPSGRLLRARQGVLVDGVTNQRVYGDTDRQKMVRLIPFLIPRWVPERTGVQEPDEE